MPYPTFEHGNLCNRRSNYRYPAIALEGDLDNFSIISFDSTIAHDQYLRSLLHAKEGKKRVFGYLAVVFWGHYSGQDERARPERALGKVNLAYNGKNRVVKEKEQRMRGVVDRGIDWTSSIIERAINEISNDSYVGALDLLCELPQISIAFASKICAFIDPLRCGVIDSVVARRHPDFGFSLKNGYVEDDAKNRYLYNAYCSFLQKMAAQLNAEEENSRWTDRDGFRHTWRAVDVERALY